MDMSRTDGNLVALCGDDGNIQIFDRRQAQIARIISGIHLGRLYRLIFYLIIYLIILKSSSETTDLLINYLMNRCCSLCEMESQWRNSS